MRRCVLRLFQSGVHVPASVHYRAAARMRAWPEQRIPANFRFTAEQRFRAKSLPRDTGKIPRNFVLSVLYRHQPCEVSTLWERCVDDPHMVLDSRRHLREVLQQARAEGFVSFEQDAVTRHWLCILTRERFDEVRAMVRNAASSGATIAHDTTAATTLADASSAHTPSFAAANDEAAQAHVRALRDEVAKTTRQLRRFQRTQIDYLPYTDLNGKVNFMWWYEMAEVSPAPEQLVAQAEVDGTERSNDGAKAPTPP